MVSMVSMAEAHPNAFTSFIFALLSRNLGDELSTVYLSASCVSHVALEDFDTWLSILPIHLQGRACSDIPLHVGNASTEKEKTTISS